MLSNHVEDPAGGIHDHFLHPGGLGLEHDLVSSPSVDANFAIHAAEHEPNLAPVAAGKLRVAVQPSPARLLVR